MASLNAGLEAMQAQQNAAPGRAPPLNSDSLPWGFSFDGMLAAHHGDGGGGGAVDTAPSLGGMMSLEGLEDIIWGDRASLDALGTASLFNSPRDATPPVGANGGGGGFGGGSVQLSPRGASGARAAGSPSQPYRPAGEGHGARSADGAISAASLLAR
jgi:hypothetical protein